MPEGVGILGFQIKKSAKTLTNQAYSIPITVPLGTTRVINFPTEFNGVCSSIAIQNQDAGNAAIAIINNDRINSFSVLNGSPVSLGEQWIVQVEVTAGAAAAVLLVCEIVPSSEVL